MIRFKTIRYKNLLGSGNYITEVVLDKAPLTVIVGKNGAGKSTILDALSFVLFNKPFRNINKAQLVNSTTKKKCVVETVFEIGNDSYRVVRAIKPNAFQIFKNEALVPPDAANGDYQEYLERYILRCNFRSFCQVVILGSASYVPFLDLPAPKRREIVENILDLEIFSLMNAKLSKRMVDTKNRLSALDIKKTNLIRIIRVIDEARRKQLEERDSIIANHRVEIVEAEEAIGNLVAQMTDETPAHAEIELATETLNGLLDRQRKIIASRASKESEIGRLQSDASFYHKNDNCPKCRQEISPTFKAEFVEQTDTRIASLIEDGRLLGLELETLLANVAVETVRVDEARKTLAANRELKRSIDRFNDRIHIHTTSITQLVKAGVAKVDDSEYDSTNLELQETNLLIEADKRTQNVELILSKMLKDDGIKASIIDQYVTLINELINGYLYEMDFMCQFMLDSEFNETIKSRYRDEFTYNSFSEGEKLRISLAVLFTWRELAKRRNSISTNLLFFDEILDRSLDSDGISSLVNVIKRLTKDTNTFIISHNSNSTDIVDNTLVVRKIKGFSHLEEQNK